MRLDVNNPDFWDAKYLGTKVFLDDEEIRACVSFDDIEGWVNAAKFSPDTGRIMVKPDTDEIWTERLYGKVTYQLPWEQ